MTIHKIPQDRKISSEAKTLKINSDGQIDYLNITLLLPVQKAVWSSPRFGFPEAASASLCGPVCGACPTIVITGLLSCLVSPWALWIPWREQLCLPALRLNPKLQYSAWNKIGTKLIFVGWTNEWRRFTSVNVTINYWENKSRKGGLTN